VWFSPGAQPAGCTGGVTLVSFLYAHPGNAYRLPATTDGGSGSREDFQGCRAGPTRGPGRLMNL